LFGSSWTLEVHDLLSVSGVVTLEQIDMTPECAVRSAAGMAASLRHGYHFLYDLLHRR